MDGVSEDQRAHFERSGYLVIEDLVEARQVQRLRRAFEEQTQRWAAAIDVPHDEYLSVVSQWTNLWTHGDVFRQQLQDRRVTRVAAELIGCDRVRVFHDHVIAKPPRGGGTIPWHRDLPNWPIREPRVVSCWLALDDVTEASGAMRFMPGGHTEPITASIDFLNESKTWGVREGQAVSVPVSAGSVIFHHCLSWHSSPPNETSAWRRAYIAILMDGVQITS